MNLLQAKRLVKEQHEMIRKGKYPRPLCLMGEKGIGKTTIIRELAKEMGVEFRLVDISSLEPVDFCGVMIPNDAKTSTLHLAPDWVPEHGEGILLIDEVNRAQRDTKPVLLTFLRERRVHAREMGKGWSVVCAGNPDNGSYEVNEMDDALKGRLAHIEVHGDRKVTLNFFEKRYPDNAVTRWITAAPDVINFESASRTDPRSLESLAIRCEALDSNPKTWDRTLLFNIAEGEMEATAASAFLSFLTSGEFFVAEDIFNRYDAIKKKLEEAIGEGRNDILNALNRSLCGALKNKKDKLPPKHRENATKYLEMLPVEQLGGLFTQLRTMCDHKTFEQIVLLFKGNEKIKAVMGRIYTSGQ